MTSTFGNHGSGAQNTHSGTGSMNMNSADGQFLSVGQLINLTVDSALLQANRSNSEIVNDMFPAGGEGVLTRLREQHTPSVDDVIKWVDKLSDEVDPEGYRWRQSQQTTHRTLLSQRAEGTGDWLTQKKEFVKWQAGIGGFLWLDGIIGSGKSVLGSWVVHQLRKAPIACEGEARICAFIYFHDGDKSRQTLESLYASVLDQILRELRQLRQLCRIQQLPSGQAVSTVSQDVYKKCCNSLGSSPTTEEYLGMLKSESSAVAKVFLLVDGFDTYHNIHIRKLFIEGVRTLTNWNVLITSRRGVSFPERLNSDLKLEIETAAGDIKVYVERRINENDEMSRLIREGEAVDPGFKDHTINTIVRKTQGMFLLAKLHMDRLASQKLLGQFREMLGQLPENSEKTFATALQAIQHLDEFDRDVARHVLSWAFSSMQPVTVEEVGHAFAVEKHREALNKEYLPSQDQLTSSCVGIVVVDEETSLLLSVHDDVREYVRKSGFLPKDPDHAMALQCLAYLSLPELCKYSFDNDTDNSNYFHGFSLLRYAAKHWYSHFQQAQQKDELEPILMKFLENTQSLSLSFRVHDSSFPSGVSGLHACAYFGEDRLATKLLAHGISVDSMTSNSQTPLHWAVHRGDLAIAELLLQHEASPDAQDSEGNTPLHAALSSGRNSEDMIGLLLREGARVDIPNNHGYTPLRWCLYHGPEVRAVPLIQSKAEFDIEDQNGWTPLRLAAVKGRCESVKLMVEYGHAINRRGSKDGWTILRHASQSGDEALVSLLLAKKADVDLRDKDQGLTPLRWAILYSHISVAKLLLENGADANAACPQKLTPLIHATKRGDEIAVWLLLKHGARVDDQENEGNSPLHIAVMQGQKSLAWLLVENGANVNVQDLTGQTPLHWATRRGYFSLAWFLTEKGSKINIPDSFGQVPMHLAAQAGHINILKLFAENECDFNIPDYDGRNAMHHAAIAGDKRVVSFLIPKVTVLNSVDQTGKTALHHAASRGFAKIVQLLLDAGSDPSLQDKEGQTALHQAICGSQGGRHSESYDQTVFKLAKIQSCLNKRDKDGRTALMHAARQGNELFALCLIESGEDTLIQDERHWTARDYAADGGCDGIAKVLSIVTQVDSGP